MVHIKKVVLFFFFKDDNLPFLAYTVTMVFQSEVFKEFTAQNCNRYDFLCTLLTQEQIPFKTILLNNKKHLYIQFSRQHYDGYFKTKTIIAHYDRAENTPGANDNSAVIFQIIEWIKKLQQSPLPHNIRIIFTDGEEITTGAQNQGAFELANYFKKLNLINDDIIILDSCGRGDTLVISNTGINLPHDALFTKKMHNLHNKLIDIAKNSTNQNWVTIPVPYGDNAGFIACGIPAIAITVLPKEEATSYMRQLQKDKKFQDKVLSNSFSKLETSLQEKIPLTWRMMHTQEDTAENLTKDAFLLMKKFLDKLAKDKEIAF